jgi:hypothetical protein
MKAAHRIRLERFVINPAMKAVLRSPLHGRLSDNLAIVSYRGRRSGRRRSLPVAYAAAADGGFVIAAGDASVKLWWRNFRQERALELRVQGRRLSGRARLATSPRDISSAREAYVARFPRFRDTLTADADVRFLLVNCEARADGRSP